METHTTPVVAVHAVLDAWQTTDAAALPLPAVQIAHGWALRVDLSAPHQECPATAATCVVVVVRDDVGI